MSIVARRLNSNAQRAYSGKYCTVQPKCRGWKPSQAKLRILLLSTSWTLHRETYTLEGHSMALLALRSLLSLQLGFSARY